MGTDAIIGGLVTAILGMASFFVLIMKDERARNDLLTTRMGDQNKVVTDAVAVLGQAVEVVRGKQQLYDAIDVLHAVADQLKDQRDNQRQVFEAIEKLNRIAERFDRRQEQRRERPSQERQGRGKEVEG